MFVVEDEADTTHGGMLAMQAVYAFGCVAC
jgi:hypothetical protein